MMPSTNSPLARVILDTTNTMMTKFSFTARQFKFVRLIPFGMIIRRSPKRLIAKVGFIKKNNGLPRLRVDSPF